MKHIFIYGDTTKNIYTNFDINGFISYFKLMQYPDWLYLKLDASYDSLPSNPSNHLNNNNEHEDCDSENE